MTEIEHRQTAAGGRDGDEYLYDYFKYLTSVSLVSLGALFTFLQMKNVSGVPSLLIAAAAVVLGASAFLSFSGAQALVAAKSDSRPVDDKIHTIRKLAPNVYLVGFGILSYICGDVII